MKEEDVRQSIEEAVEGIFLRLQIEENATGDISPMDVLELDRMEESLARHICKVVSLAKKPAKKRYRVFAETISDSYIDLDADSEEEAREIAEGMDGGAFTPCESGDWRITTVDILD